MIKTMRDIGIRANNTVTACKLHILVIFMEVQILTF